MPDELPPSSPTDAPVPTTPPGSSTIEQAPDHRDMYLLILGLLVGLALSPWLLGRFLDEPTYNRWYFGGGEALEKYEDFTRQHEIERRAKHDALLQRLKDTGATKEAVDELQAEFELEGREERKPYTDAIQVERAAHEQWYRGLMLALVLASAVLMFAEPLFDLPGPMAPLRRRLVTGRYVLLATWIALALAKPHTLIGTPWVFVLLLVIVAIAAAILAQLAHRRG